MKMKGKLREAAESQNFSNLDLFELHPLISYFDQSFLPLSYDAMGIGLGVRGVPILRRGSEGLPQGKLQIILDSQKPKSQLVKM